MFLQITIFERKMNAGDAPTINPSKFRLMPLLLFFVNGLKGRVYEAKSILDAFSYSFLQLDAETTIIIAMISKFFILFFC